jgi:hypothetical protein
MFNLAQAVKSAVVASAALAAVFALGRWQATGAAATDAAQPLPVPVSINALMVTMIDHSAHHIWDHQALERALSDDEWRLVEYFAIQLGGAASLITLGGSGPSDAGWAADERWRTFSQAMSGAALIAMDAAKTQDKELLDSAGDALITSCQSCHDTFKPALPTEGIMHMPEYDHLYHLFE